MAIYLSHTADLGKLAAELKEYLLPKAEAQGLELLDVQAEEGLSFEGEPLLRVHLLTGELPTMDRAGIRALSDLKTEAFGYVLGLVEVPVGGLLVEATPLFMQPFSLEECLKNSI